MKKNITLIFILLLIFPIISAVEFDVKDSFSQGETLTAKLSGNFVDSVSNDNIFFYRGHVRIAMNPEIAKINDEYYIYAQLSGKNQGNYSVSIENVKYMKGSEIVDEKIIKNFTIINTSADFSINPGFVITNQDFFIQTQNLKDSKIDIKIKTDTIYGSTSGGFLDFLFGNSSSETQQETSVTLKSGEIKKINFNIKNITQTTLKTIELSTGSLVYTIPVYILVNKTQDTKKEPALGFGQEGLNVSISTDSKTERIIYLTNTGKGTLVNITLSVSESLKPYISVFPIEIKDLEEGSSVKITLDINSDFSEKSIEGEIKAKNTEDTGSIYAYFELILNFIEDYKPLPGVNETIVRTKTCLEINGTICDSDEKCEGKTENAKDGVCCIGTCKKEDVSNTGKIIGWTIVVIIVLFLLWFFKTKYKGAKKEVDLLKIGSGKR